MRDLFLVYHTIPSIKIILTNSIGARVSVVANYRAAFFLELLVEINPELKEKIDSIYKEGNELLSIIVASLNTLRGN